MRTHHIKTALPLTAAITVLLALLVAGPVMAVPVANRFLFSAHIGLRVNKTTGGDGCTVASKDECVPPPSSNGEPIETSLPGAFRYPQGVAVDNDQTSLDAGDVYVAESQSHRVQELTSAGQFVRMFGWEVNETKDNEPLASQTERNVCAAGESCTAGVEGAAPGQFGSVSSIAVDPRSGDVYVMDQSFGESGGEFALAQRIQKFTATGRFVLEIGKEVNETTKGNLCTAEETEKTGVKCTSAALRTPAAAETGSEPGAFNFESEHGNLLTVGGPQNLLYVGDQGRVQKFEPSGEPAGEISLNSLSTTGRATGVAVDSAGDVFLSDTETPGIHEYNDAGVLQPEVIDPASMTVRGIALDPNNQLGIIEGREGEVENISYFHFVGVLYSTTGVKLSEFTRPSGQFPPNSPTELLGDPPGLAFAASGQLYVIATSVQEVEAYTPVVFPETRTCGAEEVTATTANLCGEVNPDGVPASVRYQYGTTPALGSLTPVLFEGQSEAFTPVRGQLMGLDPNQAYYYRVAAEAAVNGETLSGTGEVLSFHTPVIAPQIPSAPSASFVSARNAILNAVINPEHTPTRYYFQYATCPTVAGCATVQSTPVQEGSQAGPVPATQELQGLLPTTTYSYRLLADNEFEEAGNTLGGSATGVEGTFTTAVEPGLQATTGPASAVTATTALIAGTANPGGHHATYTFELGVYAGAATQYGIVLSGPVGAETTPVGESFALTGLQPGTTYAYKIAIRSGYGAAEGQPVTFTTAGLPTGLAPPPVSPLLATPTIAFPTETKGSATTPKALTKTQKLGKALKLCKKDRSRAKKAKCEKSAHRKYGTVKKSKKK